MTRETTCTLTRSSWSWYVLKWKRKDYLNKGSRNKGHVDPQIQKNPTADHKQVAVRLHVHILFIFLCVRLSQVCLSVCLTDWLTDWLTDYWLFVYLSGQIACAGRNERRTIDGVVEYLCVILFVTVLLLFMIDDDDDDDDDNDDIISGHLPVCLSLSLFSPVLQNPHIKCFTTLQSWLSRTWISVALTCEYN